MTGEDMSGQLSDKRLEYIRKTLSQTTFLTSENARNVLQACAQACAMWLELLAEVDRLRAENAVMRVMVEAVARFDDSNEGDGAYACHWCGALYDGVGDRQSDHLRNCLITQACAILAGQQKE